MIMRERWRFWVVFCADMIYEGSTARLVALLPCFVSVFAYGTCSIDSIHFTLLLSVKNQSRETECLKACLETYMRNTTIH